MAPPDPRARLGALLPAAGGSRRLGHPKQLIEVDGTPLVRRAADLLLGLEPVTTVVVLGADARAIAAALSTLPVTLHHNPNWRAGMGGSIAAGMGALAPDLDAVLLMLCDQWRLQGADLGALYAAWRNDPSRIAAARWADAFGPPAIFPRRCFAALRALSGDAGAKALIGADADRVRFVTMANAGHDLNTQADLGRAGI